MSAYDDEEGMDAAVERARERGGKDTFGVLEEKKPAEPNHIAEAVESLMPPEEKKAPSGPEFGPVEPPPAAPAADKLGDDIAPVPEAPPEKGFESFPDSSPAAPAAPDKRMAALEAIKRLADFQPTSAPAGLGDGDIAAAQQRDRQQTKRNDLSRAFVDLGFRRPFTPSAPTEGSDLLQRRQLADASTGRTDQRQLSAQEAIVKALTTDEKPVDPSIAAWHAAQAQRWNDQNEREKTTAEAKAADTTRKTTETSASLVSGRRLLLQDPRVKAMGITDEMVAGLDDKGIAEVNARLGSLPKPGKAKGGAGAGAPVKAVHALTDIADPADRAKVEAILSGRMGLTEVGRKDQGRIAGLAAQIDPKFDTTKHSTYQHVATQTAEDTQISNAINAKKHFTEALAKMPANFDSQLFNRVANAIRTGSGGAGLSEYEAAIAVGAGEMAKGLGENDQHGKESLKALLEPGQSPEQMRKHLKELIFLQDENLETKRQKFKSAAPEGTPLPNMLQEQPEAPKMVKVREKSSKRVSEKPADVAAQLVRNPNYEIVE